MPFSIRSSHLRYREYRRKLRERRERGDFSSADTSLHSSYRGDRPPRKRVRSFFALLREFFKLARGQRARIAISLFGLTIATVIGLVPLYGTKIVFDGVLSDPPKALKVARYVPLPADRLELLAFVAVGMIVLTLVAQIFGIWSRWNDTLATQRVRVAVRRKAFEHAVRLPLHRVYELKSGGVASILREDAGQIGELVFSMLHNPWRAIIQLLGSLIILVFVDWRLLLGSLIIIPAVYFTHRTWISRIRPLWRDIRNTRQGIDAHATEAFGGMRVVRSFSRQRSESASFTATNHLMTRQEIAAWWWSRGIDIAWSIFIPTATALLLWYGGMRVLADMDRVRQGIIPKGQALTTGDLVMFLSYLASLLGPIATLAGSATGLQNQLAALDRVLDLLAEPLEMPAKPDAIVLDRDKVAGRLTVDHVSFAYSITTKDAMREQAAKFDVGRSALDVRRSASEAETNVQRPTSNVEHRSETVNLVLHDITLDIHPGEMVALVGPSGAGKTTLCNLIARFYDPTQGAIRLDGIDLRDITVESYRRLLGIVEQDTFLFDGTIAENIAYGRKNATMEQIMDAAQQANAHGFITQFDKGYESVIGERGVKLSGGQRQRVTIARAILADPKILILDEATSNLDTESERLIQTSLHTLMAGRTSFVIAHRLSTIRHADRIVVMEDGRIVEQGRHEELMQSSGRYRTMVELQTAPPAPPARTRHEAAERMVETQV